ncbi:MAG TPA: YhjD/YihY/BrkB family envelope integrity protein [Nocardioides sp.]|uniref:YihY/virulence factor BrkB family protein n=1 Tax=Nocardioides sp. TaxID=35761 RepID=UPI002C37AAF8|nr:YhjD/YihY/BrkB family envelope integrity protein [Nocardioides sp.]HQR26480.1 YhjD/YihY/BrkB family envelope integrity protein [Nocardioides sp.]
MTPDPRTEPLPQDVLTDQQQALLAKAPLRVQQATTWALSHWPGRIAIRVATGLREVQIFDRAMTVAAQLFTSIFPIIIMGAAFFGADQTAGAISGAGLPSEAEQVLDDVVVSGGVSSFGVLGFLVVLVSATSLSRALTRAYDTIWQHERTRTRISQAWRWLAAVIVLAIAVVLSRYVVRMVQGIPPPRLWSASLSFAINTGIAMFVPWLLMMGRVRIRLLAPGAALFALAMILAHPFSVRYLGIAVESSAARYGAIGVAFAYLAWLYAVSFMLLATAVLGRVIATDEGPLGVAIRGNPASGQE